MPLNDLPPWVSKLFDDALDQWSKRARADKGIEEGSSLAAEDANLPNASSLTWIALTSGVNHLTAIRSLWRTSKRLHIFADPTLLRAALLAASTAVYFLDASPGIGRHERLRRLAVGRLADADDRLKNAVLSCDLANARGDDPTEASRYKAAIQKEVEEAEQTAKECGATKKQRERPLPANECIRVAAGVVARQYPAGVQQSAVLTSRVLWQAASADAHARSWQVYSRLLRSSDPNGPMEPDMDANLALLFAAAEVLNHGWLLWQLRTVNHPAHLIGPL